jgi:hypothetical protein
VVTCVCGRLGSAVGAGEGTLLGILVGEEGQVGGGGDVRTEGRRKARCAHGVGWGVAGGCNGADSDEDCSLRPAADSHETIVGHGSRDTRR